MRKNMKAVIDAWTAGRSEGERGDSISTDGDDIYSYDTCLLTRDRLGNLILNSTAYSNTTTRQQNSLLAHFNRGLTIAPWRMVGTLRKGGDAANLLEEYMIQEANARVWQALDASRVQVQEEARAEAMAAREFRGGGAFCPFCGAEAGARRALHALDCNAPEED